MLACAGLGSLVALLAVGCGDDSTGPGGGGGGGGGPNADPLESRYTSGSRLKIQVQRAGDAEIFNTVIDSQLDSPCFIEPASDDSLRCVPSAAASVAYRDATCTDPVVTYYPSPCGDDGPGAYAARYELLEGCAGYRSHVYAIGEEISPTPTTLYQLDGGNCYDMGASPRAFEVGDELDVDAMVAIELVEAPRGDALTVQYFHSEDGFYLIGNPIHDVARDTDCHPQMIGSKNACAPFGDYVSTGYFSDAGCTTEGVIGGSSTGCEQSSYAVGTESPDGCETEYHVYEVGEALTAVYVDDGVGGCAELPGAFPNPHAIGAQVPDDDLPAVELATEGEGEVRVQAYQAAGLPIVAYGNFVTSDGELCFGYAIDGDTVRCAPPTVAYVSVEPNRFYSDAGCTDIVVQIYAGECEAPEPTAVVVASGVQGECTGTEGIYEVGASYTGTVYSHDVVSDACVEYPASDQYVYRQIGERIPNDSFVPVTIETL